jgi:ABC-2 type transport system ATP-binding protein/lipopolysaccharide transport system ATP-binding protein
MAVISVSSVSVDIPVYDIAATSIRKHVLAATVGGRFARSGHFIVVNALKSVSFDARRGDRIGLLGINGSGKSTLLRVLSGAYPPTAGSVVMSGRISALFDLGLGRNIDATGYENIRMSGIFYGLQRKEIEERLDEIADFTGLGSYLSMPIRTYSAGMQLRLSFAIATACNPEILLIDEVIGAGDAIFFQQAFSHLEQLVQKSAVLVMATHDESIIRNLCNKAIWLHQGSLMKYGDVENVLKAYHRMRSGAAPPTADIPFEANENALQTSL